MNKKLKRVTQQSEFYVFLIIVALSLIIQARSGLFFANNNIVDIIRSMIVPSIYAICALLAFVSTGPDVSFPLIAALSSYLATIITIKTGYNGPVFVVFLIAMFFGMLMGAINGFIIVKYKFPSLIVTLGTSSIFSGILLGAFEAERMDLPETMANYGKASLLTVKNAETGLGSTLPMTFLILAGLYIITYLVLNYTMVGRGVYAIGGDEISAERAGFNVKAIRFGIFVVNGIIAAIAGVCYTVMSMRYLPTEFAGGEMIIIAAVILGGTRMAGGVGTLKGCLLGTLLLTMVSNSLILVGISVYWQKIFIGAIIIIGTAISAMQSNNASKIKTKMKKEAA
ncbi:ABC transporter permease [Petroclostridium sp. X23]|uniref:ABC transporter permease n=1 Tax=Petroclostridium sp. X23 TaxID=3045146 RepID=UPI0024ACEDD2|nr:ABC transporter permease [Petroclostridium sp. X23]WHH60343.1 ABC transporter permease [Petroclostridium sp. X23]